MAHFPFVVKLHGAYAKITLSIFLQMMSFPIDSVFPEDSSKLLTSNLYGKQPSLVQVHCV